jgi:hypothetical protein
MHRTLLRSFHSLASLIDLCPVETAERAPLGIAFDEVLPNLWADRFEDVAHMTQDRKVSKERVAGLLHVVLANFPVRSRERPEDDSGQVRDRMAGKAPPRRRKDGREDRCRSQAVPDLSEHISIPKLNKVGKVVTHSFTQLVQLRRINRLAAR